MFNFLSLLSWSPDDNVELMSKDEIIKKFNFNKIHSANPVFDIEKLNWMNQHYIQMSPIERIVDLSLPHLKEAGYIGENVDEAKYEWLKKVVSLFKDGLHYVAELKDKAKMFFVDDFEYNSEVKETLLSSDAKNVLTAFKEEIENMDEVTEEGIKELLKMLQKKIGVKGKAFFMPIRFALTGQDHGPELVMIIPLLGKQKILQRIDKALKLIS